jgi:hypothetical protein
MRRGERMGCSALRSARLRLSQRYVYFVLYRQIYPTSARARVATAIGWVECLCRLGGGWRCADLNVAATGAIKERLPWRAVATCCADGIQHRAAHY